MAQLYHDAMALVRKYGTPSLFITMTANPKWYEIDQEIPPGSNAVDHPTVTTRMFQLKSKELLHQLIKMGRLGRVVAFVLVIEFQKRGLPHLHLMLTLDPKDRPTTPEEIDRLVYAKIPDPATEPTLYKLVSEFHTHGPCRNYGCWTGKNCKLGYPKPFTPRTVIVDGAYPSYLRRDEGRTIQKGSSIFTNGNIVPYIKFLTLMFECHINVEIPVNSTAIKYLYKYITKGHNRSYMAVDVADETEGYVDGRSIVNTSRIRQETKKKILILIMGLKAVLILCV
jgi:hypothetical protein